MAQQKIISGNSYKLNNGKILAGGSFTNTSIFSTLSIRDTAKNSYSEEPRLAQTTTAGVTKPYSAGTFMYQNKNEFLLRGYSSKISGVANSTLRIPGSDYRSVALFTFNGYRRYSITSWNYVTGAATKAGTAGDLVKFHDIANNNDDLTSEAYSPNVVPGEFTIRTGAPLPVNKDYDVKTVS